MKPWNNPTIVKHTLWITTAIFVVSEVGHVWRMIDEQSALGQNPWSWLLVVVSLAIWLNFYRVCMPTERDAPRATSISMLSCIVVLVVVWWFQ